MPNIKVVFFVYLVRSFLNVVISYFFKGCLGKVNTPASFRHFEILCNIIIFLIL